MAAARSSYATLAASNSTLDEARGSALHKFSHISYVLTTVAAAPVAKSKFIVFFMQTTLSSFSPLCSSVFYSVLQLCDRAKVKLKPFFLKVHFHSMAKRKISVKNFANHSAPFPPQAGRVATHKAAHKQRPTGRQNNNCLLHFPSKASSSAHQFSPVLFLCLSHALSVYAAHKEKNLKKQNKSKARQGTRKIGYTRTRSGATPKRAPAPAAEAAATVYFM